MPRDSFVGMAVEGLEPASHNLVTAEAAEIADLTLFYGNDCSFDGANEYVIAQFKYSVTRQHVPFRASDAKKTLTKFAAAYLDLAKVHGKGAVAEKLRFEIVTNRPMYDSFTTAIHSLASSTPASGEVLKQAEQIRKTCGLSEVDLVLFAGKITFTGLAGTLQENQQLLSRQMVDWTGAPDILAKARLEGIKSLVRKKAGSEGMGKNLIRRTDVLAALEISGADDLLPCPASFPEIGPIVERVQLADAIQKIPLLERTLVIHASGGVGKTVFMQSLANALSNQHKTILFDCFGGGNYRALDDSRHLPKVGLIHIVNSLATEGLCDPLLPSSDNQEELLKSFRLRLGQAISAIQRYQPNAKLLIFLDAIDNAAEHARDRGEDPFPTRLIESFHHLGSVPGVRLIVSCRPYRKKLATNDVRCEELELKSFDLNETSKYLKDRLPDVTNEEVRVAQSRSLGNPRVLEHLAIGDRQRLVSAQSNNVIELDELIKARIEKALEIAYSKGNRKKDIQVFLAGLSILPPPVPISDYALASGLDETEIQSFAADMAPLLEISRHGLMFGDEPTEDYIKKHYAGSPENLRALSAKLNSLQNTSVYAAGALPWLLLARGDSKQLFKLAFDERYPSSITSAIGRQGIRYSRLKSAVRHAVSEKNYNHLVHFCVELSTLAATNERGIDYILDNPDLVVADNDIDSLRRLQEVRTSWPGTREARLSIANALFGDKNGAEKHASSAMEWIAHYYQEDEDYKNSKRRPSRVDLTSVPFCRIVNGDYLKAVRYFSHWKAWYAFELTSILFPYLRQALQSAYLEEKAFDEFIIQSHSSLPLVLGVLSFACMPRETCEELVKTAAHLCSKNKEIEFCDQNYRDGIVRLNDGLLNASARAISYNKKSEAIAILAQLPTTRPGIWTFNERHSSESLSPFLIKTVISSIAYNRPIIPQDILPDEIDTLDISSDLEGQELISEILSKFEAKAQHEKTTKKRSPAYSYEQKRKLETFLKITLGKVLTAATHLHSVMVSPIGTSDVAFLAMVDKWDEHVKAERQNHGYNEDQVFQIFLYFDLMSFIIWVREDISAVCIKAFIGTLQQVRFASINKLTRLITTLSSREQLHPYAGELASHTRRRIESEDDVNSRASGFANLARAILQASRDEAGAYYRLGLEQMDSIGSGDYQFTSELLEFASKLQGEELNDQDIHTLSNICEMNIYEAEKFPWASYSYGFSRAAGLRTFAKLSRWDDRDKVPLEYSLLPCIIALIEHRKIDPAIAISLLHLTNHAEFYTCGTSQLIGVIMEKKIPIENAVTEELVNLFQKNNPGSFMADTYTKLSTLAKESLGEASETFRLLKQAGEHYAQVRRDYNDNQNYRGNPRSLLRRNDDEDKESKEVRILSLVDETNPNDNRSLACGIDALEQMKWIYDLKQTFYEGIRSKVTFGGRVGYIQSIAAFEHLSIYTKLKELQECKSEWIENTFSLEAVFSDLAIPLIQTHSEDFIQSDYLSHSKLIEVSILTGVSIHVLAMELVRLFASPTGHVPATVWISLAALLNDKASTGDGQKALSRLLNSNAARLSETVADGPWVKTLTGDSDEEKLTASLIWRMLGAATAEDRWRAAHSMRVLARFGRWHIIDLIIGKYHSENAGAYQAPELPFFHLHAKLWLLVGLARIALDFPKNVGSYKSFLFILATDEAFPHVLIKHFSASALMKCADAGTIDLTADERQSLSMVNKSTKEIIKTKKYAADMYSQRPEDAPKVEPKFSFDYDFNKHEFQQLVKLFDAERWEIENITTKWVRTFDKTVRGMYETGGRETPYSSQYRAGSNNQSYGYQLGWHAHFLAAGELLQSKNILMRSYDGVDPWCDWLQDKGLSRQDGQWISDGLDSTPFDTRINLLEKGEKSLKLTGDKAKLLKLIGIESKISENLVVKGHWASADGIVVEVASALVPPQKALQFSRKLVKSHPFQAWLPEFTKGENGDDYVLNEKEGCAPWIARADRDAQLDRYDPFGASCVLNRYRLAVDFNKKYLLTTKDPFEREWFDQYGAVVFRSQAWGGNDRVDESSATGLRLSCASSFLKKFLKEEDKEFVILLLLQKYDEGLGAEKSKYRHTMAVVHVNQSLEFNYIEGIANKLHVAEF